jgi:hypothetical protein
MTRSLKERIERLEQRFERCSTPRLFFKRCDEEQAGEITGVMAGNLHVLRVEGESEIELLARARELAPDVPMLFATYAEKGRYAPPERDEEAEDSPDAPDAEIAPATLPVDPFTLAGIGRAATREELERMGAIHIPPERLI